MNDLIFEKTYQTLIDLMLTRAKLFQFTTVYVNLIDAAKKPVWYAFVPIYHGDKVYVLNMNLDATSKSLCNCLLSLKKKIEKYIKYYEGIDEISCATCDSGKPAEWGKNMWQGCKWGSHSHEKIYFCVFYKKKVSK